MSLNQTNVIHTAQQLLAYTVEAPNFSDKVDVIIVAEMIEKFGMFVEKSKDVSLHIQPCPKKLYHQYILWIQLSSDI